ncbi:hypothetical protein GCM10020358_50290 [Amorphoplanes nipponensis]|uniref:Uncharacterized protein n=1 Tax=Actinoplanes nipponensis TaxID=135950 RepID=A0A919MRZ4_9ACTN|nr:hypothetical protein [Actinoplanes nipponensis]GIE47465.1 hypothetical protein Ani05nite_09990 [Actinoplanes nipponensis]
MRQPPTFVVLAAALLVCGATGCSDTAEPSSPPPVSAPGSAPAGSAPATSVPSSPAPVPSGTGTTTAAAAKVFPLIVTRRGGFAGVDDRASITADGSVVVTMQGRPPVRSSLPAATMAELRRLLTAPDLTGPASPAVCNDGFEYEFVGPSVNAKVQDCGASHGATMDAMLAVAARLFQG